MYVELRRDDQCMWRYGEGDMINVCRSKVRGISRNRPKT